MNSNLAEAIEIVKSMNDEELNQAMDILNYMMKLSSDERKEFYEKVNGKLAEMDNK